MDVTEAQTYGNTLAFAPAYTDQVLYNGREIRGHVVYGEYPESGETYRDSAELYVRKSDVPKYAYKDSVTIDGENWKVQRLLAADKYTWRLAIERDVRPGLGR